MYRGLLPSTLALLVTLAGFSACSNRGSDPAAQVPDPALAATPRASCGPGSRPETGIQGRVSAEDHESGRAAEGYTCNTELVGSFTIPNEVGHVGGYKVERYVDAAGHECAYYDTTALFPSNVFGTEAGVNVLDMSDPSNPVRTERLVTPAMLSPHESLLLNQQRGLLVAVLANPVFLPGVVDVYDLTQDCRHPVLKASAPVGILGHESGMAPDGRTYYVASLFAPTLNAVDISDPSLPRSAWIGDYMSHGLSISDDGNRAYLAANTDSGAGLIILDTSEVQARVPNPTVREVARLTWESISTPQITIPITIGGHPYLVEMDEFVNGLTDVGAGRIIDIGDETQPKVISNLRLAVHQPENFPAQANDPGNTDPELRTQFQGYAGHYCNVPQRKDPGIVACSMLLSGLRVFDIRDPFKPREIAYFNAPVQPSVLTNNANHVFSSPAFVPERGEIWYSDANSGFYAVRLTNGVWPFSN